MRIKEEIKLGSYVCFVGYNGKKYDNGQRALSAVYGIVVDERLNGRGFREVNVKRLDTKETAWLDEDRLTLEKPERLMTIDEKIVKAEKRVEYIKNCIEQNTTTDIREYSLNMHTCITANQHKKLLDQLKRAQLQVKKLKENES
jgi:hypothetical protein